MISAVCWVPKGVAKELPDVTEPPSQEEIKQYLKSHGEEISNDENAEETTDDDQEMGNDEDEKDPVEKALAAAHALGSEKAQRNFIDDVSAALNDLDMEHYDEEDADVDIFGNGALSNCYYSSNDMDPYLQGTDEEDEEEVEDKTIKPSDLLILCARNEDDLSHLEVWIYDEETGEDEANMFVHHEIILPAFPLSVAWLDCNPKGGDKGNYVAVGSMQPEIELWDVNVVDAVEPVVVLGGVCKDGTSSKTSKPKKKSKKSVRYKDGSHTDAVLSLAWNTEYRNVLASGSADKTLKVWDIVAEKCEHTMNPHTDKVQAVSWNPKQATVLLSGSFDHTVAMMDMRAPTHPGIQWHVSSDVESLAWDPHSEYSFVVSVEDGTVQAFDIRTATSKKDSDGKPIFTLHAHDGAVCAVSYNPAAPNLLATGSTDKMVKLWDITNNQPTCIASSNLKVGAVFTLSFSADSPFLLASGGSKGKLHVWDILENSEVSKRFGRFATSNSS
eukprot:TRINITY_DN8769_c0_g1_i1.p1 TRINITY_DN8769_c0_g1~~TRINITY_DN8769_c0_g1_i1.p1  ORF type:complete len:500 (+),score=126.68 TRINITY_DN8769_c0_g1_i1:221-1720(+)